MEVTEYYADQALLSLKSSKEFSDTTPTSICGSFLESLHFNKAAPKSSTKIKLLKDLTFLAQLNLMSVYSAKRILADKYDIFLETHHQVIRSILVSTDNKYIYSNALDGTIRIWNIGEMRQEFVFEDHSVFSSGGLLCCSDKYIIFGTIGLLHDTSLVIINITEKTKEIGGRGKCGLVVCTALTSDNTYIALGYSDRTVRLYNIQKKSQEIIGRGDFFPINYLLITNDDKYIVYDNEDSIVLWNICKKKQRNFCSNNSTICCLALTWDSKFIISALSDTTVRVWDLREGTEHIVLRGDEGIVFHISIASDNTYIVTAASKENDNITIIIWDLSEKTSEEVLSCQTSSRFQVKVTDDNKYIICISMKTVFIWDIQNKRQKFEMEMKMNACFEGAFAVTSNYDYFIDYSESYALAVWNVREGRREGMLSGHTSYVKKIIVTADMKYVISSSHDCTVRVWSVKSKRQEAVLQGHRKGVYSLGITSNGLYIVSGSVDCTVRIWKLSTIIRKQSY